MNSTRQPDRFTRKIDAHQLTADTGRVALVEDEIEHVKHRAESEFPFLIDRHAERNAGRPDALLCAADPLRERRLGTRNARAISAVVRPPTALSVRANARIVGHALMRPLERRRDERFLHRIFGFRKITEATDHRAEHLRRQIAQQALGKRAIGPPCHSSSSDGPLITWRTSIGMFMGAPPSPGAADAHAAISHARSAVSTSIIQ